MIKKLSKKERVEKLRKYFEKVYGQKIDAVVDTTARSNDWLKIARRKMKLSKKPIKNKEV